MIPIDITAAFLDNYNLFSKASIGHSIKFIKDETAANNIDILNSIEKK